MRLPPRRYVALLAAAGIVAALLPATAAAAAGHSAVTDPASLVNPLIGTSGQVDTFPGADAPFGMLQWSPDTPNRPAGGGYEYTDTSLTGYSLTHLSGPGCSALGDVPILPTVGAIGDKPGDATDSFSHLNEKATAGSYSVSQGSGIGTTLAAATHSGIGTFTFPRTSKANVLLKVAGSANTVDGTSATVMSDHEVTGSVTAGHFCGASGDREHDYTLHFDIVFDRPFSTYGTWTNAGTTAGSRTLSQHATRSAPAPTRPPGAFAGRRPTGPAAKPFLGGAAPNFVTPSQPAPRGHDDAAQPSAGTGPGGVYLTFDAMAKQTVSARVGVSFTSDANATKNLSTEIPNWNLNAVAKSTHDSWNSLLRRIAITGGTQAQQQQFYTALYHVLLHPNVFSDVNGQYMGFDGTVHTAAAGHAQYANYSGWDIYRSQVQLAAMLAPHQTSDSIRSMLNQYDQSGMLPKWSMNNGESYVMVGDPADPIIADAYAFGARDFDTAKALTAMKAEATTRSNIRPGQAELDKYGYLPQDVKYGCCNFYGPVSTQLEYDSADHAIATFAKALGDSAGYTAFATRAQNWQNSFNAGSGYMQPKLTNGQFAVGFSPGTGSGFVEGTAAQYTPMVPFNLAALVAAHGGNDAYNRYLDGLLTNIDTPTGTTADLSNEPSIEIPWEYDYTGAPYKTQGIVRQAQQKLYFDAPVGQFGNDDLGTMSAWYVWSELGMYPETPGSSTLALGSPVFEKAVVTLGNGRTLTIGAPNAAVENAYVNNLTFNGGAWSKPWLDYSALSNGGTLNYDLTSIPNKRWGADPADAPPSDPTGEQTLFTSATPGDGTVIAPGASTKITVQGTNIGTAPVTIGWKATADGGLTVSPSSGTFTVPPGGTAGSPVTVTAGATEGRGTASFQLTRADGTALPAASAHVAVARPGELWPYYTNAGISADGKPTTADFDSDGYSYSADALAAAGLTSGAKVTSDGVSYQWPDAKLGDPDNIEAAGQTIPLPAPSGATKIGFLGSATNADATGAAGTVVVHYTDGSQQQLKLGVSDWTLGAGSFTPLPGDTTVAATDHRNSTTGKPEKVKTYVFATNGTLTAGKTVASITLPTPTADMHVFAIGFG